MWSCLQCEARRMPTNASAALVNLNGTSNDSCQSFTRAQGLEFGQERRGRGTDLVLREPRRDVLRTVPVEGFDAYHDGSLGTRRCRRECQCTKQRRLLCRVCDPGCAPDLESAAIRIVHQDECDSPVAADVANAQILSVATVIRIGKGLCVHDFQESGRTAPKLNIG